MSYAIIELRPDRLGWKVFECAGVEPIFCGLNGKELALKYATERLRSRKGEIRVLNAASEVEDIHQSGLEAL